MVPGQAAVLADVLVLDGRIAAIGQDLEAPAGVERIDASGKHLVPGLVDGMIHHDLEHDPLYVGAGITLARDLGNDLGHVFIAARPAVRDNAPGPDLYICGAVFDGVPPATTESIVVTSAAEVEDKLGRLLLLDPQAVEDGLPSVDFISFHRGIPRAAWKRLVELGQESGLSVWGPLPSGADLAEILESGQDGLLYIESLLSFGGEGRAREWQEADAEFMAGAVEALRASGTALTPMLRAYALRSEDPGERAGEILAPLSPQYASLWRHELAQRAEFLGESYSELGRSVAAAQQTTLLALHEAGVPLLPGSGSPNPWLPPGDALHEELALWVEAGIPPLEVLRHATAGAARVLGVDAQRGSLQEGLVADLLIVDGDPRADLRSLRRPSTVVLRGRTLERGELDALHRQLVEAQEQMRARAAQPIEVEPPDLPEGSVVLAGYVETSAFDQRFSAERYAVVREPQGSTAYVGRVVTPGGVGSPPSDLHLLQRIADIETDSGVVRPTLIGFELVLRTGGNRIVVEGRRVGGQFNVRRLLNGVQVDNNGSIQRPLLVDAGSVTAALILAQHVRSDSFDAVYFEDLEPAIGPWSFELRPGGILAVRTPQGPLVATFKAHGGLARLERVLGRGRVRMEGLEAQTFGGPGLALPPDRVATPDQPPQPPPQEPAEGEGGSVGGD